MGNLNINLTEYINKVIPKENGEFELVAKTLIEDIKSGKQKVSKFYLLELD